MTDRAGRLVLQRPARLAPAVRPAAPRTASAGSEAPHHVAVSDVVRDLVAAGDAAPDVVVLGGGCAGLALAVSVLRVGAAVTVVEARSADRDDRTWCYWDTGAAVLPEAVTRSWQRWEVLTPTARTVATDPDHPYRMVHARDYRAAARAQLAATGRGRLLEGVHVHGDAPDRGDRTGPIVIDARGPGAAPTVPAGRTVLQQRFVGQWIRTTRPVFDVSTVTLMDFSQHGASPAGDRHGVRFFYVLPVAADLALVEFTVFARCGDAPERFRAEIADYLRRRWALRAEEWCIEDEERGSIRMTDARPPAGTRFGIRAGIARASTGYAFTRIQLAARGAAARIAGGEPLEDFRDRLRVRALDAVFLRFLRDQPQAAPAVFLRLFDRLPGPLTIRFLTERSTLLDDVRLILVLPKRPFLRAAASTFRERLEAFVTRAPCR